MEGKWLSAAEESQLAGWCLEWHRAETNTARANRRRAEGAIADLYRCVGEAPPAFWWVESPLAAVSVLGPARAEQRARHGPSLADQLKSHGREEGWDFYRGSERYLQGVWARVGAGRTEIHTLIRDQVLADLPRAHDAQRWADEKFRAMVGEFSLLPPVPVVELGDGLLGCQPWLRCNAYLRRVGYFPCPDRHDDYLEARMEIASCGVWWWPHQRTCVVADRPEAIHCDAVGRLHHASEPALRYRDGYALTLWHGTAVPESWIAKPQTLDPAFALTWPNAEQRRAAGEIVGWARVVDRFAARTVDKDADPEIGELVEVSPPGGATARFLRVRCGTGRAFVLSVPREMQTAREANAWTYGLEASQYQLEART